MSVSAHDRRRTLYYLVRLNLRRAWDNLTAYQQVMVGAVLWATFVLVAFPQFGDLVERAIYGEVL